MNDNPKIHAWIRAHGLKVEFLPTLVLVKAGRPMRTTYGTDNILNSELLRAFALGEYSGEGAVAAARQRCAIDAIRILLWTQNLNTGLKPMRYQETRPRRP